MRSSLAADRIVAAVAASDVDAEITAVEREEREDLGDDPRADGEVAPAEAEDERRDGKRDGGRGEPCESDGGERRHVGPVAEQEQPVRADADEGLLSDRDEARVAREQVPHLGQCEQCEELDEVALTSLARPPGNGDEHSEATREHDRRRRARPRAPHDRDGRGRACRPSS